MIFINGLVDKVATMQVFGCIMKEPLLLAQVDKYRLVIPDFDDKFTQIIFGCLYNMFTNGARTITVLDIDNYLSANATLKVIFDDNDGTKYIMDCEKVGDLESFPYYYSRVKKFSALRALDKDGFDISDFYCESPLDKRYKETQARFEESKVEDIFVSVKKKLYNLEDKYVVSSVNTAGTAAQGLRELKENYKVNPEIGLPLQGEMLNSIVRGARKGKYYLSSAPTGAGKTRMMVGNACNLSIPVYYDVKYNQWIETGFNEISLFITTELKRDEIQTLILAWVSGVNEEIILNGHYTGEEEARVDKAITIIEQYETSLQIEHLSDPSIVQIEAIVRRQCLTNGVQNVFYDYIFSSPSLINEFKDAKIREDVALAMLSTALKDLAVELDIFVMSGTQVSGDFENKKGIRNEKFLRGSKAIADKADVGMITMWVGPEENAILDALVRTHGFERPNYVTDIYKGRRNRIRHIKVWSKYDLGICRTEDMFVTDGYYNPIPEFEPVKYEKLIYDEEPVAVEIEEPIIEEFIDTSMKAIKPEERGLQHF